MLHDVADIADGDVDAAVDVFEPVSSGFRGGRLDQSQELGCGRRAVFRILAAAIEQNFVLCDLRFDPTPLSPKRPFGGLERQQTERLGRFQLRERRCRDFRRDVLGRNGGYQNGFALSFCIADLERSSLASTSLMVKNRAGERAAIGERCESARPPGDDIGLPCDPGWKSIRAAGAPFDGRLSRSDGSAKAPVAFTIDMPATKSVARAIARILVAPPDVNMSTPHSRLFDVFATIRVPHCYWDES